MDDLISRQVAIDSLTEIIMNLKNVYGNMGSAVNGARECIKSLPSAEPERTAKVETVEKPNVFKCSECGQYFHSTSWGSPVEYCSRCGCRLDWNEDIPMEYFESGGR